MASGVPKPGPAKLGPRAGLDEWLEQAKLCRYLPEGAMKQLCEMVKECLMEGMSFKIIFPGEVLTLEYRVKHSASADACHNMWRYSRPILRST